MAIDDTVIGESGDVLHPDSLKLMVQEISWVPTQLLIFQGPDTLLDRLIGAIEHRMKEILKWWPLRASIHAFRDGFCRPHWRAPCGTLRHVDVQSDTQEALKAAFDSAPVFLDLEPAPSAENIEQLYAKFGREESSRLSFFRYLGKLTRVWRSPRIIYSSMALDGGYQRLLNTPFPDIGTAGTQSASLASPGPTQRHLQLPDNTQHQGQYLQPAKPVTKSKEPRYLYLWIQL
jgi:hypothetical protein